MIGAGFQFGCASSQSQMNGAEPIRDMPRDELSRYLRSALVMQVDGYRCANLVALVNTLHHMGKEKSLNFLEEYCRQEKVRGTAQYSMNVLCICRILFVPPSDGSKESWHEYDEKHSIPVMNPNTLAKARFPLYPMAVVDGVPFVLDDVGISAGGDWIESWVDPKDSLNRCRGLELIHSDLPTTGYARAALKLIRSEDYQQAYSPNAPDAGHLRYKMLLQAIDEPREPDLK